MTAKALAGMIPAGLPLLPTLLVLTSLSVLITWLYAQTGGKRLLSSLFHAAQSFFIIVNKGIPAVSQTWLMGATHMASRSIVVVATGPGLVQRKLPTTISNVVKIAPNGEPVIRK